MVMKKMKILVVFALTLIVLGSFMGCSFRVTPRGWYATGVPTPDPMQISSRIVSVSSTFAITEDGQLWSWPGYENRPARHPLFDDVIAISVGGGHRMVIASDGTLWGWGSNDYGQVGTGRTGRNARIYPATKIMEDVIAVSAGSNFTMAITSDNALWGWGNNAWGKLGDETTNNRHSPVKIMEDVIAVSAGSNRTVAITSDNILWGWGRSMALLENETRKDSHTPIRLMEDVISACVCGNSLLTITSDNVLRSSADSEPIMEGVIAVCGTRDRTMAITSDNVLWGWGRNTVGAMVGMLGDGTFRDSSEPIKIMENVVAIFSGSSTFAITSDGSLWAWGNHTDNQLGIGTDRGEYEADFGILHKAWLSPVLMMEYVPEG